MANHPIVHIELSANDPEAAAKFYNSLFDWNIEADTLHNYWQFKPDSGPGGGFNKVGEQGVEAGSVLVYVSTDDIDSTLARIEALGGKIVSPKMEIPYVGWFGIFEDPTGNQIGLYTAMNPQQA